MSSSTVDDVLSSGEAGGKVIRGSAWRLTGNGAGILVGLATATLLLRHLGVAQSGRYVTVMSLVAIASSVVDLGLNVSASRELALRDHEARRALMANILGQRLWITPIAVLAIVAFALLAGYPASMEIGALLAGTGLYVVAVADALLLPLTVELRNAGLGFVDFLKQAVSLAGVALLVALGAQLTAFFAVLVVVGLAVLAAIPLLAGRRAFVAPRLERPSQRMLLRRALPLAMALVLGQLYFRMVILLMSLISNPRQTGYFGGSLRAMEALVSIPILVAGVALPVLAAAARDDRARLRYAIEGLSEGAVIAGVLLVLVTVRAAEPVMAIIGGGAFRPAGEVLRIQVVALTFGALVQIWAVSLVALGRQRELILTNALGLLAVALFAAALVGPLGARGGALASVLGDLLLASLVYWRLRACDVRVVVRLAFLARVALAAAAAAVALVLPIPDLLAAVLAGALFVAVGQLIGMVPAEVRAALAPAGQLRRPGVRWRRGGW
ncbi:MAG TPA: oligosaccharide flippase family protein [Solirubrobacteraceae bacterium]|nr:oligosaccharide flippase family protein [Solirubrobacteraceae bacterium]